MITYKRTREFQKEQLEDLFLYINVVPEEKKNVSFYQKYGFKIMEEGTPLQIAGNTWR